ncbi:hypothetical protein BV22DRAFT_861288 [Leucogyrophana mollusca]|uniref:Uncharacterized protein n=1 Tax=Leucogyrophana mollusca TaxID=85980 RepID=A0ACB8B0Z6_9AGAM|nr:hypothetical protein BV22DRAFT_861288 [Leucogyrophana mollusca]
MPHAIGERSTLIAYACLFGAPSSLTAHCPPRSFASSSSFPFPLSARTDISGPRRRSLYFKSPPVWLSNCRTVKPRQDRRQLDVHTILARSRLRQVDLDTVESLKHKRADADVLF